MRGVKLRGMEVVDEQERTGDMIRGVMRSHEPTWSALPSAATTTRGYPALAATSGDETMNYGE